LIGVGEIGDVGYLWLALKNGRTKTHKSSNFPVELGPLYGRKFDAQVRRS
jgi:hypothetical protein